MSWKNGEFQPKQKRADEKKARILDAALALFSEKGYHRTTAKAVAARAGVATGSFYRYFRDKKAVFMAACMRMEAQFGGRMFESARQMRQEGRSEPEVLRAMVRFAVRNHRHNMGFHREVLAMQMADADVAAFTGEREKRMLAALQAFLKSMRAHYRVSDLAAATELIYYATEEVAHRAILMDSPVGEERLVDALEDMLMRYLFR